MEATPESMLAGVEVTSVEENDLASFKNEGQHYRVAFGLFRETAICTCILASTTVGPSPAWNVKQAVLGGHLVRLFKLMKVSMEEAIEHRDEVLSVLVRLMAECVINLRYLLQDASSEQIRSYLSLSLQQERELAILIRTNIAARGGEKLPIEDRMLRSISRTFENSQIQETELPEKKIRNWGGKNLYEKAEAIGLGQAYFAVFGLPSRNVHGGW